MFRCRLLILTLAFPSTALTQAPDHIGMGRARIEARDLQGALEHFKAHLAADPNSYEANWRTALALVDIGKQTPDSVRSPRRDSLYAEAERYARKATEANPGDAEGHFVLSVAIGRASLTQSKRERIRRAGDIREEALRAIELNARHDGAHHVMGRWNAEIMRLSAMQRFFAKSFLGGSIFNQASWDRAIEYLQRAVTLAPTTIYHHLDLAEVYIDRKRYTDARRHLEQIATLPVVDVMDARYQADALILLRKIENKSDK